MHTLVNVTKYIKREEKKEEKRKRIGKSSMKGKDFFS
jgi:hypothetical protein